MYIPVSQRGGNDGINRAKQGIAGIESGGRYNALGPRTNKGQRAYGKYQVMDFNIPAWTKEALGKPMTPAQFLNNPRAQEKVFEKKFQQYADKYGGYENAAKVWFGGPGALRNPNAKDILGTSVTKYAEKFRTLSGSVTTAKKPAQASTGVYVPVAERKNPVIKAPSFSTGTVGLFQTASKMPLKAPLPGMPSLTTANSTQQVSQGGPDLFIGNLPKAVVQGMGRGAAAVGTYVPEVIKGVSKGQTLTEANESAYDKTFKIDSVGKRLILGEGDISIKTEVGDFLKAFNASDRAALTYSGPLGIALTASDLFTGGGAKTLIKAGIAAKTAKEALAVLRTAKISDEIIFGLKLDGALAEAATKTQVETILKQAADSQINAFKLESNPAPPVTTNQSNQTQNRDFDLADNHIGYNENGFKLTGVEEVTNGVRTVVREEKRLMDVNELPSELADKYKITLKNKEDARGTGIENATKAGREFQDVVNEIADYLKLSDVNANKGLQPIPDSPLLKTAAISDETRSLLKTAEEEQLLGTQQKGITKEALNERRVALEVQREALENNPARELSQFVSRKKDFRGRLAEEGTSKNGIGLDQRAADAGFENTEAARVAYDDYKIQKEAYESARQSLSADVKAARLESKELLAFEKALRPIERLTKRVKKATTEAVKKVENRATKRQVAFEKREAKRQVAKAKDEIIEKLKVEGKATAAIKNDILTFVKKELPPAHRGKALTLLRDAKTQRDLVKAFSRINRWAEDAEKVVLRNDILKTQRQILESSSIAVDYKARVKALMADFELKGHRESSVERLRKTQEFLQAEIAKGNDVEIPRRLIKALGLLNRTPFEKITLSQLTGLKAEMELLEELGRTKFKTMENLWDIQKEKIVREIEAQGEKPITNNELLRPEIGERLTITQKFRNLIIRAQNQAARIDKAISPMDAIFDLLDGGKATYTGANYRFFKAQVDAGYGRYITRKDALQNPVIDLAAKYKLNDTNFERIGVVAAREQDGGVDKLLATGFTQKQIDEVVLSPGEKEVLDLMRSTFDSQFSEIQDVMRRVYNKPVEKVKNYFSFMTDWKAMDESEVFNRFGSQDPEQYGAPRKNVEAGFAQSRVGGDQKIKINALDVFMQHTDNTSYLLELGETSKMLGEVAASPKYAEIVGDVGQLMVREWLDVISRKGGAAGAQEIAVLNTLRRNVGVGILGLKLSTIAIQPTSVIDGMGFIGAKYGMKGVTNFTTSGQWRKFIANMPEIKDRLGGEFALRELSDDKWLENIQRKGFIPLQKLDQMSAGMIAAGAYERKMAELGRAVDFNTVDPEALAYAQLAVRRTQSSGSFKDVPLAISRGALTGNRSLDRAILQFQNFLLSRWSRVRHDAIRAGINTKDPTKAVPIFTAIIMSAIAASGVRLGVNKVQDFVTGRDDEDSPIEDVTKSFMYEIVGNVPFLGTTVSMAMYDGEMFPILDAPKGVISGLNRVITSESESAKLRGFTEFAGSVGAIMGIPGSAQTEQLVRGALQEQKAGPTTGTIKTPPGLPELPQTQSLPSLPGLPPL